MTNARAKTFEQGKDEIARKVEYFTTNRDAFRDFRVKEADVRQSLIDAIVNNPRQRA